MTGSLRAAVVAGLALALLSPVNSAQAQDPQGWTQTPGSDKPSNKLQIDPERDPYTAAMVLKQRGQYADAMPLLQRLAMQGAGYEIAQLELGNCYLDLARHETDDAVAQHKRTLGLAWILRAAAGNLGAADERLVRIYLDGEGIIADNREAAKWYFIWRRNPARMALGASQFDSALEQRLKAVLPQSDLLEAQHRAEMWKPL